MHEIKCPVCGQYDDFFIGEEMCRKCYWTQENQKEQQKWIECELKSTTELFKMVEKIVYQSCLDDVQYPLETLKARMLVYEQKLGVKK